MVLWPFCLLGSSSQCFPRPMFNKYFKQVAIDWWILFRHDSVAEGLKQVGDKTYATKKFLSLSRQLMWQKCDNSSNNHNKSAYLPCSRTFGQELSGTWYNNQDIHIPYLSTWVGVPASDPDSSFVLMCILRGIHQIPTTHTEIWVDFQFLA